MVHFRNKLFLAIAFLALSVFLPLSLGGEFLHQHIHHHQSKASQNDCPIVQLLTQTVITIAAIAVVVLCGRVFSIPTFQPLVVLQPHLYLPNLRAPPSLS
jgi:hypothetical protein